MANDYVGFPNLQLPEVPQGGLAGILNYDRWQQSKRAQGMSLQQMLQELKQKQAESQRYQAVTPNEIAKSNLEGTVAEAALNQPGYAEQKALGQMGSAAVEEGRGRTALGESMSGIVPEFGENPMAVQMRYKNWLGKLPKDLQSQLPPVYVPDARKQMEEVLKRKQEHDLKLIQEQRKEEEHRKTQFGVAEINARSRAQQVAQRNKSLEQMLKEAKTTQHQISISTQILNDAEVEPALKQKAMEVGKQARLARLVELGVRIPPQLPGLPPHQAIPLLDQLMQQHMQQGASQGQPGQPQRPPYELWAAEMKRRYPTKTDAELKQGYMRAYGG